MSATATFVLTLDPEQPGGFTYRYAAADGCVISIEEMNAAIGKHLRMARANINPDLLLPTVTQWAAFDARAVLPEGWEVTLDGINMTSTDGEMSYSRTYRRVVDDMVVTAPCAADGTVTDKTVEVLEAMPPASGES